MSSAQLCHCGQRSLSWNVVSLDFQQQCSWLNQKPERHTPPFMSVSQWAAMSMPPARAPGAQRERERRVHSKKEQRETFVVGRFRSVQTLQELIFFRLVLPLQLKVWKCLLRKHPHQMSFCILVFCPMSKLNFFAPGKKSQKEKITQASS